MTQPAITGGIRFAPSPTGTFHLGNLRTAWISHEWARRLGQPWVVRFEDIDRPRVLAGAQESQLADMAALGLVPDQLLVQSAFHDRHWAAFARAVGEGRVYPCYCSRKEVQEALHAAASAPHAEPPVYSGHCRTLAQGPDAGHPTLAWRFRMEDGEGTRDFIVARTSRPTAGHGTLPDAASFVPAYNWACAVDDWDGGYGLLVRAWDLAHVAEQQRSIQLWLRASEGPAQRALPAIFHTALVTQNDGHRLEKRTRGVTLAELRADGRGPEALRARFRASFDIRGIEIEPGRVAGEEARVLPISRLLI